MCASGCLGSGGDETIVLPASRRNLLPDFLDLCFCLSAARPIARPGQKIEGDRIIPTTVGEEQTSPLTQNLFKDFSRLAQQLSRFVN